MSTAFTVYGKLFKNPAAVIFTILFLLGYTVVFYILTSKREFDILEIIKAAPFAFSAIVLGVFSVIFWALNYIGKQQKLDLEINESKELFLIRKQLIDKIFDESGPEKSLELSIIKAHFLFSGNEINSEPETPSAKLGFEYGDAVKALLRRP
ncbi:MAG: hypothetical protein HLX50_13200 [Alteromonadaceae bacterium]|nr:hypothetical protein [Alteromonadaceae bacterium]